MHAQLTKSGITLSEAPTRWLFFSDHLSGGLHLRAHSCCASIGRLAAANSLSVCKGAGRGGLQQRGCVVTSLQNLVSAWQLLSNALCLARWRLLRRGRLPGQIPVSEILSAATSKHRAVWRGCCPPWRGPLQVLSTPVPLLYENDPCSKHKLCSEQERSASQ